MVRRKGVQVLVLGICGFDLVSDGTCKHKISSGHHVLHMILSNI
jgi:hypothetical protein